VLGEPGVCHTPYPAAVSARPGICHTPLRGLPPPGLDPSLAERPDQFVGSMGRNEVFPPAAVLIDIHDHAGLHKWDAPGAPAAKGVAESPAAIALPIVSRRLR
jgi:hypothetical protein